MATITVVASSASRVQVSGAGLKVTDLANEVQEDLGSRVDRQTLPMMCSRVTKPMKLRLIPITIICGTQNMG